MPRHLLALTAFLAACTPAASDVVTDDSGDSGSVDDSTFRVALLADPHVIGDDYGCCESPGLDTESIYKSRRRFRKVGELLGEVEPAPAFGVLAGDVFHQAYKHDAVADYLDPEKGSAPYRAKEILDTYPFPVHLGWGNHDYDVPEVERSFSHQVFEAVFDTPPYQAIEFGGWRFLLLNTQLGRTWDPMSEFLGTSKGSLGREQLAWMADQLSDGTPTVLVLHHHPLAETLARDEDPDGPWKDVYAVVEAHRDVIAGMFFGHLHRWVDVQEFFGVPAIVLGSIRYDADNFWIAEFDRDGTDWQVVDRDKASWGSPAAFGATYEDGGVQVDFEAPPEDDPAGPWDGWETPPDPWPPEDE